MEKKKLSLQAKILSIIGILILSAFVIIYFPLVLIFGAEGCVPLLIGLIFAIILDIILIVNLINPLAPILRRRMRGEATVITKSISLDSNQTDTTIMYCSNCGTEIHQKSEKCIKCGKIFT